MSVPKPPERTVEAAAVVGAGEPPCYCPPDTEERRVGCPTHGEGIWPEDRHRRAARRSLTAAMDPALGDDMLVPLGWVKERLTAPIGPATGSAVACAIADFIDREARS